MSRLHRHSAFTRYAVALLATVAALVLRLAMAPVLEPGVMEYAPLLAVVVFTGWWAGIGPSIVSLAVGTFVADYLFVAPVHTWGYSDDLRATAALVMYVVLGIAFTFVGRAMHRSQRDARAQAELAVARQRELERTEAALRDADRRKDEFLAVLAHELRNPLAPVRNAARALRLAGLPPSAERPVAMIERQTVHMARLIEDLLDVSRITRGVLDLRPERLDFAEVAHSALDACRDEMEQRRHTVTLRLPDPPVTLEADRHRLVQVFGNLLVNAARYTPPGGHIVLTGRGDDGALVVTVSDDGIGIEAGQLDAIFELFTQVGRSTTDHGGLGIGLTLARQLVELHHGSIAAASAGRDRGSTFTVRLPAVAGAAAVPVAPASSVAAPRRVLVADDNHDTADSLALLLALRGHVTRAAYDGEDALMAAAEFRPDVVIVDIGMPKLDGYEVARRLRAADGGGALVLVALTGWGQDSDRQRALANGFDAHLVKPADPELLEQVLATPHAVVGATGG